MEPIHAVKKNILIYLSHIPQVGWHTINKLIRLNDMNVERWSIKELQDIGFRPKQAQYLLQYIKEHPITQFEKKFSSFFQEGYQCVTYFDQEYPELLRQIAQPPWVLYAKGNIELLKKQSIAIVGTRYPSPYGKYCAEKFSNELSNYQLTIVSGLAKGIDTYAHRAALKGQGSTIAVLPTALNECYPKSNYSLYREISEHGLLLTETPFGTKLHPGQFHQRNRIIAGLSRASIIIEGKIQSGSMITAKHAFEMDRELFAVPGGIQAEKSEGPNFLIQKGYARILLTSQQLFEELEWLERDLIVPQQSEPFQHRVEEAVHILSKEEQLIVSLLHQQPLTINELLEQTGIPFGHLNVLLLNLCINKFIEMQAGSIYRVL